MQSMPAPKKCSDELRERATRMALDAIAAEGQRMAAIRRVAGQLDVHPGGVADVGQAGRDRRRHGTRPRQR
jgi:transposase-like protein